MTNNILSDTVREIKEELHSIVAAIKTGVSAGLDWIKSEAMKVVVLATQTNFGTKVLNLVSLFDGTTGPGVGMSGSDKMKAIVKALFDAGESLLVAGGWQKLFASAVHFLQGVVQLIFTDFAAGMAKLKTA